MRHFLDNGQDRAACKDCMRDGFHCEVCNADYPSFMRLFATIGTPEGDRLAVTCMNHKTKYCEDCGRSELGASYTLEHQPCSHVKAESIKLEREGIYKVNKLRRYKYNAEKEQMELEEELMDNIRLTPIKLPDDEPMWINNAYANNANNIQWRIVGNDAAANNIVFRMADEGPEGDVE